MLTLNKSYFLFAVCLFLIELFIALFLQDRIIRPYVGDFLVVMLLYCTLKTFFDIRVLPAALAVLLFSYLIEFLQYIKILKNFGLEDNKIASVVLGSHFEWMDIYLYTAGVATIVGIEKVRKNRGKRT